MEKLFLILGSFLAGLGVATGAFGAHALEGRIDSSLIATFETGARYHFYHALGLFAVALVLGRWPAASLAVVAGWLFVAGVVLFSGSLYILALTGIRWLGAITPLGGIAFIGGWIALALSVWRS